MPMVRITTPTCMLCGTPSTFMLEGNDLDKYRDGALIQDAFPYLSAEDRETIMSGTHPDCWNKLYPEEDN